MKMMWPHLDCFPGNIYNFVFLDKKKNPNSKNFVHVVLIPDLKAYIFFVMKYISTNRESHADVTWEQIIS